MAYSLKQAADATGRTKPTLLRAIQTGKISAKKNEMREWEIDPAELHRVYPPVAQGVTSTVTSDEEVTVALLLLRQELAAKEERVTALQEERERERRQLTERISELRDQLTRSEEERREKDRQLTALLTDQSAKQTHETPPRPASMSRLLGFLPLVWKRQP
jgi:septal ring factor EnvC (AmiA/AmiB activator)